MWYLVFKRTGPQDPQLGLFTEASLEIMFGLEHTDVTILELLTCKWNIQVLARTDKNEK